MNLFSRGLLVGWLVSSSLAAPAAPAVPQEPPAPPQAPRGEEPPALPSAATPAPHDPLEEFVPHEHLGADSVVALPVDI